jgi:hypothetical protein
LKSDEWKKLALKKIGFLDVYHLNHMTAALFAGISNPRRQDSNSSEHGRSPRGQFLQWKYDMLGHHETDATDADPTAEMNEEHNNVQSDQDNERYNNPQFAEERECWVVGDGRKRLSEIVIDTLRFAFDRFCQAMQWGPERFHLWISRHGFFPHLSDPRAILFLVMLTLEVNKTYTSKTDNQVHSLMYLSGMWASRQSTKGTKAAIEFPAAVEAVRLQHLPGCSIPEVERILSQPLDVAQSKKYGSHAHTIPKTKAMWNTFLAEIEKEKENPLEGFRAKGSLILKVSAPERPPLAYIPWTWLLIVEYPIVE